LTEILVSFTPFFGKRGKYPQKGQFWHFLAFLGLFRPFFGKNPENRGFRTSPRGGFTSTPATPSREGERGLRGPPEGPGRGPGIRDPGSGIREVPETSWEASQGPRGPRGTPRTGPGAPALGGFTSTPRAGPPRFPGGVPGSPGSRGALGTRSPGTGKSRRTGAVPRQGPPGPGEPARDRGAGVGPRRGVGGVPPPPSGGSCRAEPRRSDAGPS